LKRASGAQPLVLVLDNLHWADRTSLLLLEFLAQEIDEGNLLVLGTYRDTELTHRHHLSQTLGELARQPSFHRVTLRGLSEEEVAQFLEANSGFSPHTDLVRAVYSQTEGNPLFTTQVVQLMAQEGVLKSEALEGQHQWDIRIPGGIYDAIGRRLDRLSEDCNRVLAIASVIGREFELRLLEQLESNISFSSQHSPAGKGLLEALEEALTAKVLEELPQEAGRCQFSHVLIQQTLVQRLSAVRRARLHQRIGEALEEHYGSEVRSHAAELAYHFAQAEMAISTEKLVNYALLAGEQALATYAHEEALGHFENGLAAKRVPLTSTKPAGDEEEAALLSGLGRAQLAIVDPREYQKALINLTRAFDYYAETGDITSAVAVAQCPVQSSPLTGHRTGVVDIITRALALVPTGSREAGYLLCQYGNTMYYEASDHEEAMKALGQALEIAQREGDGILKMRALVAAGHAEAAHLRFQESLGYDLAAIELASSVNEPFEETHALHEVTAVLHRTGNLEGARRYASAALEVAERLRHRVRLWQSLQANTVVSTLAGNWEAARSFSDRALAVSPRNPNLLGYRALIEGLMGEFDQSKAHLDRLLETMRRSTPGPTFECAYPAIMVPLIAHITNIEYPLEEIKAAALAVLSSPWAAPVFASLAWAGVALLSVREKDAESAKEQYRALLPRSGAMVGGLHDSIISADRLLGLLAHTMGCSEEASAHFQDAIDFCRKAGYRPELAWVCHDYTDALLRTGGINHRTKALSLLEESQTISAELGMKSLLQRLIALSELANQPGDGGAPQLTPNFPGGLTQRELEVLRLVASGRTSAEIAAELVLSRRTVERHISNIYVKTNSHSRSEATAFAFIHGLMPPD
jgi:DNA-binding CsgD family transcriptional regulator